MLLEGRETWIWAGLAQTDVDGHLVNAGASGGRELFVDRLSLLFLLGLARVNRPRAQLGATVHPPEAAVAAALCGTLPVAVGRADVDGQRERARRLHEVEEPAQPSVIGDRAEEETLLEGVADAEAGRVRLVELLVGAEACVEQRRE